jgi:hypothetical protein
MPSTISGRVLDSQGAAIADAFVATGADPYFPSTTADAGGNYSLTGLDVQTYTVTAYAWGFQAASEDIAVSAGVTVHKDFNLVKAPFGAIVGEVIVYADDQGQSPAVNASVEVGPQLAWIGGPAVLTTQTDANGRFTFANVPSGVVNVNVPSPSRRVSGDDRSVQVIASNTVWVPFALDFISHAPPPELGGRPV